jgi:integrase
MARTPFPSMDSLLKIQIDDYALNGRRTSQIIPGRWKHVAIALRGATHADIRQRLFAYPARRRAEGAAPATIRNELSYLRRSLNLAVKAGLLAATPPMPTITVRNARQGFIEASDFSRLHAQLPAHLKGMILFMYITGWRSGEVRELRWRDVDEKACVIRIEHTKNDRPRTLPYGCLDELRRVLRLQRASAAIWEARLREPTEFVFQRYGKQILYFKGAWDRACKRAGVGKLLPHDLRRTAVRNFERAGISRSVAMKITGHLTESMYQRYAIVNEADVTEGLEKLAWIRDGIKKPPSPRNGGRMVFADSPITDAPVASFDADKVAKHRGLIDRGWKPPFVYQKGTGRKRR